MPRFIDRHPTNPRTPPEVISLIKQRLLSGERDEYGEQGLTVFIGSQRTYCYTDAPNVDAVRRAHEVMGILLGPDDIEEVQTLP